jgi:hypothetical protein
MFQSQALALDELQLKDVILQKGTSSSSQKSQAFHSTPIGSHLKNYKSHNT